MHVASGEPPQLLHCHLAHLEQGDPIDAKQDVKHPRLGLSALHC
jgi:hypothetical protein